jgi:hypothetical protein
VLENYRPCGLGKLSNPQFKQHVEKFHLGLLDVRRIERQWNILNVETTRECENKTQHPNEGNMASPYVVSNLYASLGLI